MSNKNSNRFPGAGDSIDSARLRIGLTGGIASGKSAVSRRFAELGAGIVDTDEIARDVVKPGTDGLHAVIQAFGAKIALPDGTLDRQKLRHLVFSLPEEKARLEAILHPLIRIETLAQVQATSGIYLIVVVPLLFETDFRQMVDRILVVDCPTELQIMRLTTRDNESEEAAAKVIATQIDRDYRLARANDVIVNDGSLAQLHQAVDELHLKYLTEAKNKP